MGARPPAGPKALVDQRTKRGLKPGQLDPETAEFAHRARELAGRRSYLKNFWYAAGARPVVAPPAAQRVTPGQRWVCECALCVCISSEEYVVHAS